MFARIAAALLLTATVAVADPVITSLTPNFGPVEGGTLVRIKGTGFSNDCPICSPPFVTPQVYFGSTRAGDVRFIDSTTIDVVTPAVLPSLVSVTLQQYNFSNSFTQPGAFEFRGDPSSAFDPVLFPLFTVARVQGEFGSLFETTIRISDRRSPPAFNRTLPLYGIDMRCAVTSPPLPGPFVPVGVTGAEFQPSIICSPSTGRVLYVPKGEGSSLAASIRVADISKQATSYGVEVPIVRSEDFNQERLIFMGIPADAGFRSTLRLYSLVRGNILVYVTANGTAYQVELRRRDDQDIFEPAYGELNFYLVQSDAPTTTTFRVVADSPRATNGLPIPGTPIWGMVSVTNNQTQQITTITPN